MRVGYIGLGAMGSPLARRLLGHHELCVWDLDPEACAEYERAGASVATSATNLARRCDVVLLCLPKSEHVGQVIFGKDGLAAGLAEGSLVIDQTSGVPAKTRDFARRLADQGVAMIDAPVAGGIVAAQEGKVSIMASGPQAACDIAWPILTTISVNVFRCGDRVGSGQAMKLVNNLMNAAMRLSTLEAVAMGAKLGLSLTTLTEVLNKSTARNRITVQMLPAIAQGKSATNFALPLMVKDVHEALVLGGDAGAPLPIGSVTLALLQTGVNTLGPNARLEDVVKLVESMAGTTLRAGAAPSEVEVATGDARGLTIGYVGIGAMGAAIVHRLLRTNKVNIFDVRPEVLRMLEAEGAVVAADLPALARASDVIMICVPDSGIVREVIFGENGLAAGLISGKIVVDQTTGDPAVTRQMESELRSLGVALLDAPISGGPKGAASGALATMCGGEPEAYARALPVLKSISSDVIYCGGSGCGHIAKLVKNGIGACNRLITYEAVAMGLKVGLLLEDIEKVINNGGSGWSATFERIMPVLRSGGSSATLRLELLAKDIRLVTRAGMSCGAPMFIANAVCGIVEASVNELGGASNIDELSKLFETRAGVRFRAA
jgi:3-hydroxyisobutyrate dehydrogenase